MIRSSTVATLLSYHTGPRPLSDALRRRVVITKILTKVVIKIIFISQPSIRDPIPLIAHDATSTKVFLLRSLSEDPVSPVLLEPHLQAVDRLIANVFQL